MAALRPRAGLRRWRLPLLGIAASALGGTFFWHWYLSWVLGESERRLHVNLSATVSSAFLLFFKILLTLWDEIQNSLLPDE